MIVSGGGGEGGEPGFPLQLVLFHFLLVFFNLHGPWVTVDLRGRILRITLNNVKIGKSVQENSSRADIHPASCGAYCLVNLELVIT